MNESTDNLNKGFYHSGFNYADNNLKLLIVVNNLSEFINYIEKDTEFFKIFLGFIIGNAKDEIVIFSPKEDIKKDDIKSLVDIYLTGYYLLIKLFNEGYAKLKGDDDEKGESESKGDELLAHNDEIESLLYGEKRPNVCELKNILIKGCTNEDSRLGKYFVKRDKKNTKILKDLEADKVSYANVFFTKLHELLELPTTAIRVIGEDNSRIESYPDFVIHILENTDNETKHLATYIQFFKEEGHFYDTEKSKSAYEKYLNNTIQSNYHKVIHKDTNKILSSNDGVNQLLTVIKEGHEFETVPTITVFCDMSNSTPALDKLGAKKFISHIQKPFSIAAYDIVSKHKGCIDKFIGDNVMAVFGDYDPKKKWDEYVKNALFYAYDLCNKFNIIKKNAKEELINNDIDTSIIDIIGLRFGIAYSSNTIKVVLGKKEYLDFTTTGIGVNLAARLEHASTTELENSIEYVFNDDKRLFSKLNGYDQCEELKRRIDHYKKMICDLSIFPSETYQIRIDRNTYDLVKWCNVESNILKICNDDRRCIKFKIYESILSPKGIARSPMEIFVLVPDFTNSTKCGGGGIYVSAFCKVFSKHFRAKKESERSD